MEKQHSEADITKAASAFKPALVLALGVFSVICAVLLDASAIAYIALGLVFFGYLVYAGLCISAIVLAVLLDAKNKNDAEANNCDSKDQE